jgi:alkanesulfonate monooxygenase SsuD/methylene tetrahydromethanopterin reductase-like flavin-dependent oxidoreductase (luciferase family)
LAAIAPATERLRLGALITPLARRRPWKVARETATLDHLSGGRLIFGAGLGAPPEAEFGAFGEPVDPRVRAERLDEALDILAGLWTGQRFDYEGRHHRLDGVTFVPTPIQTPRPPIWVGGWWPNQRPFRRAARWDGVMPEMVGGHTPTPVELAALVAYVRHHRTTLDPFDVVVNGATKPDRGADALVQSYVDAGATWWLEKASPTTRFSIEAMGRRISAGPPSPPADAHAAATRR